MSLKKTLVIAVAALSATAFLGTSAQAARVKWKMHSAWGSQVPHWALKPYALRMILPPFPVAISPSSFLNLAH